MLPRFSKLAIIPLAAIAGLAAGCKPQPTLDVWVAGEMVQLTDRTAKADDLTIFSTAQKTISLFAGANEAVGFQLVLEGGPTGLEDVRLYWSPLSGPERAKIGPENIKAFRMLPVSVTDFPAWHLRLAETRPEPANFYDALLPLEAKPPPPTIAGSGWTGLSVNISAVLAQAGQPFKLAPNERLVIWVDLYVPRDASAGDYAGQLKFAALRSGEYPDPLTAAAAPRAEWQVKLAAQVYDFVLPDERPLAAVGGFDHDSLFKAFVRRNAEPFAPEILDRTNPLVRRGLERMHQLMVLAYEHRLDLFDKRIHPTMKRDISGKLSLDWTDYDAIVTPYLNGSAFGLPVGCAAWCAPFNDDWPRAENYGGAGSAEYASLVWDLLTACRQHFAELKVEKQLFLWPYRGPVSAEGYEKYVALARIARAAAPDTPILCPLPPSPPQETHWKVPGDFRRLADIFAPPGQWFDPNLAASAPGQAPARAAPSSGPASPEAERTRHPLAGAWLAPGQPPYVPPLTVSSTPADARALPWFAMKYGCTGLLLDEVLNWSADPFHTVAGTETRLFYPGVALGADEVLPSVRLKRLRRGLQDAAYLRLLQERDRGGVARTIMDSMARYAGLDASGDNYLDPRLNGWVQDGATWEVARRLLAEELHAAIHPSDFSPSRLLAQRLEWRKLDERTHTVRVEQVRTRVTPVAVMPGKKAGTLLATVIVDLFNEYGHDVTCQVRLADLPQAWKAVGGEANIPSFPPASRKTVTLTAEGDYVPASANAKLRLPLVVTVDAQPQQRLESSVPFLVAGLAKQPPTIDGQLGDWPVQPGNAAGDFKLVGRRGEGADALAKRQTAAFVLRDDKNLYIAFRCDEPNPAGMVVRSDNIIRYQQLMACAEELVEIILDPGAAAAGPEDLYHLVIKPSGVVIAERGIGSDPPLGKTQPWASRATVCVTRPDPAAGASTQPGTSPGPKVWIVELAIPLSSFGPAGTAEFWGVNFARFACQGQESSSWSGALRYFYDPRNLGTMFLLPIGRN